jgi:N-acetyl-anhydromuramyl-L-alanine amidase AmpD
MPNIITDTTYEIFTDGVDAHEIVTVKCSDTDNDMFSVTARCSACSHIAFTAIPSPYADRRISFIQEHIDQHAPGRAIDIDAIWEVSAHCTVCENGGDITDVDGETLQCQQCNTTWSMDGTFGELDDSDQ